MTEPWRSARWIGAPRRLVEKAVRRVRESGRSALARAARLTGAAVAAFVAAQLLGMQDPPPLIAALTALIVVQVTLTSTLISSLQRVLSVVVGVGLALLFVSVVGLTWWSLGAIVSVSIIMGQLLRLGPQLIEVPISAMLVLAVGYSAGAENAAVDRTLETLIGSAVGVLVNILFPPALKVRSASSAVLRLAEEIAGVLERSAEEMKTSLSVDVAGRWLEDARRLSRHVRRVDGALDHVEESRQLNVRAALDTRPSAPALRNGLDVLERCAVTIRGLFRSAYDTARTVESEPDRADSDRADPDRADPDRADPDRADSDWVDAAARRLYADLLRGLAGVVRGFGKLICAESTGQGPHQAEDELAAALQRLHACRSRAAERLLADPGKDRVTWELTSAFTLAVDRMLAELDVVEHARLREERRRAAARRRTARAVGRLRESGGRALNRPRPTD